MPFRRSFKSPMERHGRQRGSSEAAQRGHPMRMFDPGGYIIQANVNRRPEELMYER